MPVWTGRHTHLLLPNSFSRYEPSSSPCYSQASGISQAVQVLPELPPLITDILISLNDRFLYFSNW